MAQQHGVTPAYRLFSNKPFKKSLSIPDRIWNELEPQIKEKIMEIRTKYKKEVAKQNKQDKPASNPDQYPTKKNQDHVLNLCSSLADLGMKEKKN